MLRWSWAFSMEHAKIRHLMLLKRLCRQQTTKVSQLPSDCLILQHFIQIRCTRAASLNSSLLPDWTSRLLADKNIPTHALPSIFCAFMSFSHHTNPLGFSIYCAFSLGKAPCNASNMNSPGLENFCARRSINSTLFCSSRHICFQPLHVKWFLKEFNQTKPVAHY